MPAFFVYLLKVIIYSGILFGYYLIALRNKRFHYYNRFYLLMSVALSLLLPLLQLQIWQWKSKNPQVINLAAIMVTNAHEKETTGHSLSLSLPGFILLGYGIIAVCLLLSFTSGLLKLIKMKKHYPSEKVGDVLFINTDLQQAPFSFFKNLFWKNSIDISDETGRQIFRHELAHIEQKHSSDKLFLQIITLIFWANPFYWLIQKELSLIHEFIADEKAIDNKDAEAFALMLLQSQFGKNTFLPLQSFNYSPIKRRLRMLTSLSKTNYSYARRILALPVLSLSVLLFAFKLSNDHQPNNLSHTNAPFTLVVDAGHGGNDDGAIGIGDVTEKTINLSIAKKVAQLSSQFGITVKMTRTEDATVSLQNRMDIIKNVQPDACISIHINAEDKSQTKKNEISVYIPRKSEADNFDRSKLLGSGLIQSVKNNFPVNPSLLQRKEMGIYFIDANPYPAIVIECGYINNKEEATQLLDDAYIEKLAKDILNGVVAYANNKQEASLQTADTSGKQPLYIVDGKETPASEAKALDSSKIGWVAVWKGSDAVKKYGKRGENGVVQITTKEQERIEARDKKEFTGITLLDGKEITKEEMDKISPGDIEKMSVWKGEEAIKKYGEKGKNGVIEITTKNKNTIKFSTETDKPKEHYDIVFDKTEEAPSFPGGADAWLKYLQRNLRADVPAEHSAPTGTYTAIVQFQVDEEGNVSDLKATTDPGYSTGAEAVRVIQRGPKWIPAKQNGKTVTAIAKQPITFQISEGR